MTQKLSEYRLSFQKKNGIENSSTLYQLLSDQNDNFEYPKEHILNK